MTKIMPRLSGSLALLVLVMLFACPGTSQAQTACPAGYKDALRRTGYKSFDPADSRSEQLRNWAKSSCNCGQ